jgi:hypothetical protein
MFARLPRIPEASGAWSNMAGRAEVLEEAPSKSSDGIHFADRPGSQLIAPLTRRTFSSYDAFSSHHPDYAGTLAFDPFLDGRSGSLCSCSYPCGKPESDPGTSAFRPCPLWHVRFDRFCRCADWVCSFRRSDFEVLLRTARSLCRAVHGPGCREISCPIGQPSRAFLPPSTRTLWKLCVHAFKRICSLGARLRPPAACSTGWESSG